MPTLYTDLQSPPEPEDSLSRLEGNDFRLSQHLRQYRSPSGVKATLKPFQIVSWVGSVHVRITPMLDLAISVQNAGNGERS
jgi:hypothetical protein